MIKIYLMFSLLITLNLFASNKEPDKCDYERHCSEMEKFASSYSKSKNKSSLNKLILKAKDLSKKNCKIRGVRVNVSRWRACYDQGFSVSKGRVSERYKGTYKEDDVLGWFFLIKKSQSPEAKAFLNSKLFSSTLDGGLVCLFIDSDAC